MRILHLADLHLDAAFQNRSRIVREHLRDAARTALSSAVDVALARRVDVVLIAGDLFDGERLSVRTERFLLEELRRLGQAGTHVVYATGNHDPGDAGGAARRIPWPDHVTVAHRSEPIRVEIRRPEGPVGYVTAAGHERTRVTKDLSLGFAPSRGHLPEVAVLHTQVKGAVGEDSHEPYAPSELSALIRSGFDYWALGHVHTRQALSELPAIHYPGNTQGRNPRETGPRGGLFVEVSRGEAPRPEFLELGPVRWKTLRLEGLEAVNGLTGLADAMEAAWSEARTEGSRRTQWMLRVDLCGPTDLHRDWTDPTTLEQLAADLVPSLEVIDLEIRTQLVTPNVHPEEHLQREDVLGEALRLIRRLSVAHGPSPAEALGIRAEDMLGLGPDQKSSLDDYMRHRLSGGETLLLEALLAADKAQPDE